MGRARQIAGRGNNDSLVLDSSAASTDVGELLLLDATDASSSNTGFSILQEDATANADTSQMLPQRANGLLSFSEPPVELFTPVFKIFAGTDQAISDATVTVVQLDSTIGAYGAAGQDNENNFNNTHDFPTNLGVANFLDTSNYRVKPTIGGYYQINASARCGTNVDLQDFIFYLRKNLEFFLSSIKTLLLITLLQIEMKIIKFLLYCIYVEGAQAIMHTFKI